MLPWQEKELWTLTEDTGEVHSETGKPIKRPTPECGGYIAGLLGVVALAAAMVEPYIPSASARIAQQLAVPVTRLRLTDDLISKASCPQTIMMAGELFTPTSCRELLVCSYVEQEVSAGAGHRIGQPEVLFRIIDDEEVLRLRERFAGSQADQRSRAAGKISTGSKSGQTKKAKGPTSSSSLAAKQTKKQPQVRGIGCLNPYQRC